MRVLNVYYDVSKPNVFCRVTLGQKKLYFTASGFSKCSPEDRFDEVIGRELAYTRAFMKALKMYRRALEDKLHRTPRCGKIAQKVEQEQPKIDPLKNPFSVFFP